MCPVLRLGIPDLNGTTLKERSQPLDFIHNSQNSGEQMRLRNHGSERLGGRRGTRETETAPSRVHMIRAAGSWSRLRPKDVARMLGDYVIGRRRRTPRQRRPSHPSHAFNTFIPSTNNRPSRSITDLPPIFDRLSIMEDVKALDADDGLMHAGFISCRIFFFFFLNGISDKITRKRKDERKKNAQMVK